MTCTGARPWVLVCVSSIGQLTHL